jgi:hypothetical protein
MMSLVTIAAALAAHLLIGSAAAELSVPQARHWSGSEPRDTGQANAHRRHQPAGPSAGIIAQNTQPGPAAAQTASQDPSFPKDTPYENARNDLLASGWAPLISPDADKCWEGDARCRGRPEMLACAGTGEGNCIFLWRKDGMVLAVFTTDDPPLVAGTECRSGCR